MFLALKSPQIKNALPRSLFGYEVLSLLGEGAGSTIYAVSHPQTHQVYALKHVVRRTRQDVRYIHQLQTEFAISRPFHHPGLRKIIELKLRRNLLAKVTEAALVMELVDGTPIDQQPVRDLPEILDCFIQTAQALSALHVLHLVHCDLKPNNIIWTPARQAKIIDFGQTCMIGTIKKRIQGTPDYIAPEQVQRKPLTERTDVFNFGATFYWALSGHKTPTLYTVARDQRDILKEQRFPSPQELNPAVPKRLSDLLMNCVHMKPQHRPRDMGDVLQVLQPVWDKVKAAKASATPA